jgi:hypothetical protein
MRYVSAALPASLSAVLCAWTSPAAATVCLPCRTTPCDLMVEALSDCQVVPSNHEIIIRATCQNLVPVDALPMVRRATGEVVPGEWELMDDSERYRFVGADFPEGEELHLVGRAPQRCYMADVPICATPNLQCIEDDLEPKDCCALYSEAAEAQEGAADGQGGQSGLGGNGGAGHGGADSGAEEPVWLRFFASAGDDTPPVVEEVVPLCTTRAIVKGNRLYWDAPGPMGDIQQISFAIQRDDAATQVESWAPCLSAPGTANHIFYPLTKFGTHSIQATYRDWSGNVTVGPEHVVQIPEDCTDTPVDWSFSCAPPTRPLNQACVDNPLPGPPPTTDTPNLCQRGSAGSGSSEPDDTVLETPRDPVLSGTGGSAAGGTTSGNPVVPRPRSGCACATVGRGQRDRSDQAALLATLGMALWLGRRRRARA